MRQEDGSCLDGRVMTSEGNWEDGSCLDETVMTSEGNRRTSRETKGQGCGKLSYTKTGWRRVTGHEERNDEVAAGCLNNGGGRTM